MMKHSLSYMAAALLAATAALTSSCDDNFTYPPAITPEAVEVEPTITMEDLKTEYWSAMSAPTTVRYEENGDTLIFTGRVCSSDASGNIFKNIVVQSVDENGQQVAMTFAINSYDLYQIFPFGQEVAVYASGLEVGGYRNLLQFGSVSGSEMTFMDLTTAQEHIVRCGSSLPEPAKVDTVLATVAEIQAAKSEPAKMMLWQSRLVRVDGVSFEDAGKPCATDARASRYVRDADGKRLNVLMSQYADFKSNLLPKGTGSVVGILSYYNNDWQILLNDFDGLIGFDGQGGGEEPGPGVEIKPEGEGTVESPYNVAKALEIINSGSMTDKEVYVKGKIAAIGEVETAQYGNATYDICDEGGNTNFKIYRGYYLGKAKFTSADQLEVGAEVIVCGKLINYNGTSEMAQGNYIYSYNGKTSGGNTPEPPATGEYTCTAASAVESGSTYVMVVDGQFGAAIGSSLNYGRLNLTDVTITDGSFSVAASDVITFTEVTGKGYTMKDAYGRYLSMDAEHLTTFQLFTEPNEGSYWMVTIADGKATISNILNEECFVCVSQGKEGTYYANIAPAKAPEVFKLPELFKAVKK